MGGFVTEMIAIFGPVVTRKEEENSMNTPGPGGASSSAEPKLLGPLGPLAALVLLRNLRVFLLEKVP